MKILITCLIIKLVFLRLTLAQNNYLYQSSVSNSRISDPDDFGYRYCASWKLADGTLLYSTCDPFTFKRCGKNLEFTYECCAGFQKIGPPTFPNNPFGNLACAQTIPQWKSCPDVLNLFPGLGSFSKMIAHGEIINENPSQDFTIFAPDPKNENDLARIFPSSQGTNSPVFYHVIKGRFYASKLRNNQELISIYQDQKLKVTKYSFGVVCIDCVELTKADFECKNGIIHFIRKPLIPRSGTSSDRNNLFDALKSDPEISSFVNDIPPDLQNELKNTRSKAWYTVLPVKNEDWANIKKKYSASDLAAIVRNHIIQKLYCSAALYKSSRKLVSSSGEQVNVKCDTESNAEVRYVTDAFGIKSKIINQDNMAGNGVYHTLQTAVIPLAARSFKEIVSNPQFSSSNFFNAKTYMDLIKNCDLRMQSGKKYSILVPNDESMKWWQNYDQFKPEYQRFMNDEEYRCRVARYHIVEYNPELEKVGSLWHEQKGYKSNNKDTLHQADYFLKDKDSSSLYFHFSSVIGFKAFPISEGSVYRISKINVIPEKFIVDILKENPNLKTTTVQVLTTNFSETEFKPRRPLSLFLATLEDGLIDLKTGNISKEIAGYDGDALKNYLLLHTVPLYLWGGDIGYFKKNTVNKFMSRTGIELIFWMDNNQVMRIGYDGLPKEQWAEVVKFNLHAKDGIVWLLKKNLPCPENICLREVIVMKYDLFDMYVSACQTMYLPGIKDSRHAIRLMRINPINLAAKNPTKCSYHKHTVYMVGRKIDVVMEYDLFDVYLVACQIWNLRGMKDIRDVKRKFRVNPIKLARENPTKCLIYKQPTYIGGKKNT